jgi:predicted dinucleotide-binding enzyme
VIHGRRLDVARLEGINWRNAERGRVSEYQYAGDDDDALAAARPLLRRIGMAALRVAPVEI